jgi:LacI family transcriptional regulator
MAMGALRLLREEGIRIPDDLSLAGCDDIPAAALIQPALTTVWQPKGELGSLSVKVLIQQVEKRKEQGVNWKMTYPFQSAVFHPHLVIRESTKALIE